MTAGPIRVLIADDQAMVREGFSVLLGAQPDIEVVGEAENGEEAVAKAARLTPHVVLMDIRMPTMNGLEATRLIMHGTTTGVPDARIEGAGAGAERAGAEPAVDLADPGEGVAASSTGPEGAGRAEGAGLAAAGTDPAGETVDAGPHGTGRTGGAGEAGGAEGAGETREAGGTEGAGGSRGAEAAGGTGEAEGTAGVTDGVTDGAVRTRVLVLTTFDLDGYVYEALRAGASGFLLKDASARQLSEAVRVVASGEALLAPAVTRRLIAEFARLGAPQAHRVERIKDLTSRETEVLRNVAQGLSNAEIALRLVISEQTVKTHVSRILVKLGLRDRTQAAVFAYETGLIRPNRPLP